MISDIFEWLGANPTIELVSIIVFGAVFVAVLIRVARSRSPLPPAGI